MLRNASHVIPILMYHFIYIHEQGVFQYAVILDINVYYYFFFYITLRHIALRHVASRHITTHHNYYITLLLYHVALHCIALFNVTINVV